MKHLALILALLLTACSRTPLPSAPQPSQALTDKDDLYRNMIYPMEDMFGGNCDGLLFASLTAAGAGIVFDVAKWQGADGKWYRSPKHDACDPTSRDMIQGLMWYLWSTKDVARAEALFEYGLKHWFVMDDRDPSISYLWEDIQFTLALMIHRMGGKDYTVWRFPTPCVGFLSGFTAHLQSLTIGLRALMGWGDKLNEKCITEMVERHPTNAFFQAIKGIYTGDQAPATALLLNESYWPADRLPASKDRCTDWLNQREDAPRDWAPCPEEAKTHSGGDFLSASAIVLGRLR